MDYGNNNNSLYCTNSNFSNFFIIVKSFINWRKNDSLKNFLCFLKAKERKFNNLQFWCNLEWCVTLSLTHPTFAPYLIHIPKSMFFVIVLIFMFVPFKFHLLYKYILYIHKNNTSNQKSRLRGCLKSYGWFIKYFLPHPNPPIVKGRELDFYCFPPLQGERGGAMWWKLRNTTFQTSS